MINAEGDGIVKYVDSDKITIEYDQDKTEQLCRIERRIII